MIKEPKAQEISVDSKQREFYLQVLGDNPINMEPDIYPRQISLNQKNFPSDQEIFEGNSGIQQYSLQNQKINKTSKSTKLQKVPNSTLAQSQKSLEENNIYLNNLKQGRDTKIDQEGSSQLTKKSACKFRKSHTKFLLKQRCIKKRTKKFAIPKFLVRVFLKYHQQFEDSEELMRHNEQVEKELLKFNQNSFNLERDAMKFLNSRQPKVGSLNRQIMAHILVNKIRQEVILNSATQNNRISYLIGSKIYALRCRSKQLCKKANFR